MLRRIPLRHRSERRTVGASKGLRVRYLARLLGERGSRDCRRAIRRLAFVEPLERDGDRARPVTSRRDSQKDSPRWSFSPDRQGLAKYPGIDGSGAVSYTRVVLRRCLAAFAALSLIALQSQSIAFHVHAAADRDHEAVQHRHGPAIHGHDRGWSEQERHVGEASEPQSEAITIAVPAASGAILDAVAAELTDGPLFPELLLTGYTRSADVRSHGPPLRTRPHLRGPPPSTLL